MQTSNELTLNERTTHLVEYWKQATLVQQHFNDISMKVRNFAIVVFSGFLTGVGLSIHNGIFIEIIGLKFSAGVFFAIAGAVVTQLIHFMDTYWYHVFLKGAVNTATKVEKEINGILAIDKLSNGISNFSQNVSILSLFGRLHLPIGAQRSNGSLYFKIRDYFFKEVKVDSTLRHKIFYRWLIVIILLTGIGSLFTTEPNDKNKKLSNPIQAEQVRKPLEIKKTFKGIDEQEVINNNLKITIIAASNVRLRLAPHLSAPIIDILPSGKIVKIIGDSNFSWVKIQLADSKTQVEGWVYREYISILKK